ncbi:hypothetical protein [Methylobacterium platani]|nr:hypothetical protein [Methylobacterium platani]
MMHNCLSFKPYIVALPLLILGSVADAAINCAEAAQGAARRIKAWSARQ